MALQSLLGCFKGTGALAFINDDLLRSVGLFEAYLLAGLFGIVLVLLSGRHYVKQWHLLAACIHVFYLQQILFFEKLMFWGTL